MELKRSLNIGKIMRMAFPVLLGALIGYSYYYFIGCTTGSCPITSNPWSSVFVGALFGASFISTKKKVKTTKQEEN